MPKEAWMVSALFVALLIVVAVVGLTRTFGGRRRSKVRVKGPFGTSVDAESCSEDPAAIVVKRASSCEGGLSVTDDTGRGIQLGAVSTKGDISLATGAADGSLAPKE